MPEEQNIPELIPENVVEAPQPRSSESAPSANPACHTSPPALPANLSVATETIPQNERLDQVSSNVGTNQSAHRNVEMDLSSSSPRPPQLASPPHQAELEDVQSSLSEAQSSQYSSKVPGTNPRTEPLDQTRPRLHNSGSVDDFDVILEEPPRPDSLPPPDPQEPQLSNSPSEKQYLRRSHVRIEKKPRSLCHTLAIYLACATTFACGCIFGCIAYCFASECRFIRTSNCFIQQPMAAG